MFKKFRNGSLKYYGYLSAPVLSWDAMLNITKVEIELISDIDVHSFEEGMRIGVSYISKRHSKASNNYFKSYHPKQKSKHIIYLDADNLYGYDMSKFLSSGGFK